MLPCLSGPPKRLTIVTTMFPLEFNGVDSTLDFEKLGKVGPAESSCTVTMLCLKKRLLKHYELTKGGNLRNYDVTLARPLRSPEEECHLAEVYMIRSTRNQCQQHSSSSLCFSLVYLWGSTYKSR